jgi:hypothetical protein
MRMTTTAALLLCTLAIGSSACGDEGLSQQDAGRALVATSQAMSQVQVTAERAAAGGSVSAMASCSGGGTAQIDGTWNGSDSYSVTIELADCREAEIAIDGSIEASATAGESGAAVTLSGSLTYSGAVSGTCEIDLRSEAGAGTASASGSICGHDVVSGTASAHVDNPGQTPL